jgi:hypothetical protein
MGPDDDSEPVSDAERRLVELLALLAGEPAPVLAAAATARVLRRARLQRDIRPALLVSAGLAVTMVDGLGPLFARRNAGAGA